MKKMTLLLIIPLTALMAVDFTISKSGTLTPEGVESTTTTSQAAVSGIIPNSIDLIWDDSFGDNLAYTCQSSLSYPQIAGSVSKTYSGSYIGLNPWYEVEERGNGTSCSPSINTAEHTRVEVGTLRAWYLRSDDVWVQVSNTVIQDGTRMPYSGDPFYSPDNYRGCYNTEYFRARSDNITYQPADEYVSSETGYASFKPAHYWVWHGWHTGNRIYAPAGAKAVFIQIYARLVVEHGQSTDDRDSANYVIHVGCDKKAPDTWASIADIGISRYKPVTNDWQPFNFLTGGISKEEFMKNPPPFVSQP